MKSKESAGGLPFSNTMGDSFELMKKMWDMAGLPGMPNAGNLATRALRLPQQLPSMVAPTFDVDELDKRIADLRAVEQWLELNVGMLRTAIQTLEVQRATIATLKGLSGAMLGPLTKPMPKGDATAALPPTLAIAPITPPADTAPAEHKPSRKSARRKAKQAAPQPPMVTDAPLNPAAWWNTLQDQFSKIAATAAASASAPPPQKPAQSKRRSRKPAKA